MQKAQNNENDNDLKKRCTSRIYKMMINNKKTVFSLLILLLSVNVILFQNCKSNNNSLTLSQEQEQNEPQARINSTPTSYERGSIAFVDENDQVIANEEDLLADSTHKMKLIHTHPDADQFEWIITRGFEILVNEETTTDQEYQYQFSESGVYNIYATAYSVISDSKDDQESLSLTKTILTKFSKRVVIGENCSPENILEIELETGSLTVGESATFEIHNSDLFTSIEWKFTLPSELTSTAEGSTATLGIPSESDPGNLIIEVKATPVDPEQSQCLNYRKKYFKISTEESIHFNPSMLMDSNDQLVAVSLENNDVYRYDRSSKLQYISTDVFFADSCTSEVEGSSSLSLSCADGRIDLPRVSGTECQEFKTTLTAVKGTTSQEQVYYNYCGKDEETCFFGPKSHRPSHHFCTDPRLAASVDGIVDQVSHAVGNSGPPRCGSEANTCAVGRRVDIEGMVLRHYNTTRYHVWGCRADGYGMRPICQKAKPLVNGECGKAFRECVSGSPATIFGNRQWACQGSGGGRTAFCALPSPRCGSTHNTCAVGEMRDVSDTDTHCRWMCTGYIGVACREPLTVVNGQCGATHNNCQAGQVKDIDDTATHYKWQCTGFHGGTSADCEEVKPVERIIAQGPGGQSEEDNPNAQQPLSVDGICDTSQQNGCTAGESNDEAIADTNTHFKWQCLGEGSGETVTCEKERPRADGQCGSYNTCHAGDFYDRNDNNRFYRWLCRGVNGGQTVPCRERKAGATKSPAQSPVTGNPVHGECSSALNECLSGEFVGRTDTHRYQRWFCLGSNHNEARTRSCRIAKQVAVPTTQRQQAAQQVHGQCGSKLNTCLSGTRFRDRRDSHRYHRWYCDGLNGGRTRDCRIAKQVAAQQHGQCGSSLNTCLSGTRFRDRRDSRRYHRWYCDGVGGGRTRGCRIRK